MKKKLVKGCIFFMLICMTGCGNTQDAVMEETATVTESDVENVTTEGAVDENTEEIATEEAGDGEGTEETESITQTAEVPEALSDDLYSYQIVINGELYEIPTTFAELEAKGWKYENDASETLGAYTLNPECIFYNGSYDISADILNSTESDLPYSECEIVGISVDLLYNSENDMTYILPKGITSGVATKEDVEAAYGEPTSSFGDDEIMTYTYDQEYGTKSVEFTFMDGVLSCVSLENFPF